MINSLHITHVYGSFRPTYLMNWSSKFRFNSLELDIWKGIENVWK